MFMGKPLQFSGTQAKMEACLAVEREQEKVVKKLKAVSGLATEKLQQVLDQTQALKELLTAAGERFVHCLSLRYPSPFPFPSTLLFLCGACVQVQKRR